MKKIVTKKWLLERQRCGVEYWNQWVGETKSLHIVDAVKLLITKGRYGWANWLIVQGMTRKQYLQYAIYAAKQVLHLYEKQYPDDKRPREAIKTAEKCLKAGTQKNRAAADAAAHAAADAAYAAAHAAYAAAHAAYAADAAYAAADAAAYAAAHAAYATDAAAYAAADAAAYAADAAMQKKILLYGIRILRRP